MSIKSTGEKIQWGLTILNTLNDLSDKIFKAHENLPEQVKVRIPGLLGLSLVDEQIFNGVLGQLEWKKQLIITDFLYKRCQNFQRIRFIIIVAGMKVEEGKPVTKERSWDKKSGKSTEKTVSGAQAIDRRQVFLEKFADLITNNSHDVAYEYAIGARLILAEPLVERIVTPIKEVTAAANKLQKENSADLTKTTTSWVESARNWRDSAPKRG